MDAIDATDDQIKVQSDEPAATQPVEAVPTSTESRAVAKAVEPVSAAAAAAAQRVTTRANIAADADQRRKVQALALQRERILSERTSSPHRRSALATALLDIEEQLVQLGWTLHL